MRNGMPPGCQADSPISQVVSHRTETLARSAFFLEVDQKGGGGGVVGFNQKPESIVLSHTLSMAGLQQQIRLERIRARARLLPPIFSMEEAPPRMMAMPISRRSLCADRRIASVLIWRCCTWKIGLQYSARWTRADRPEARVAA